jgi:hypothetical protein
MTHCHVTTRFDVSSCPAKGGHWLTSSSAPSQVQTPNESIPCFIALASTAGTQDRMCHTAPFSTRPMDFFLCFGTYPSLEPPLCRTCSLAVVVQVHNGNAPTKTLAPETVQSCSDGVLWSNPHPAPPDCFPYARAPASMAGAKYRVRDTTTFRRPKGKSPLLQHLPLLGT